MTTRVAKLRRRLARAIDPVKIAPLDVPTREILAAALAIFEHDHLVFIDGFARDIDADWTGQTNASHVRVAFCRLAEAALAAADAERRKEAPL